MIMQDLFLPDSQLQFGTLKMINASVVEITIDGGIEVSLPMMIRCEEILQELMPDGYSIVLNERHPHTYTPEAKAYQIQLKKLKAMAVVLHTRFTDIATKYLQSFEVDGMTNLKVFYNRDKALEWLELKVR